MTLAGHPIFERFPPWSGEVEEGWQADFLGVRTRRSLFPNGKILPRRFAQPGYPPVNEAYFEWIDVLEAVASANATFTMVELGAGWGRWLAIGAAAARHLGLQFRLVAVEAEPTHFEWLRRHLRDNEIPDERVTLYQAAVTASDGPIGFIIGEAEKWWGQRAFGLDEPVPPSAMTGDREWVTVDGLSLATILTGTERVDLVDADIQGAEGEAFAASADVVDAKVKRVHIETHSTGNEGTLRAVFGELGWECRQDYPYWTTSETPWGPVSFQGGLQTWINPKLA